DITDLLGSTHFEWLRQSGRGAIRNRGCNSTDHRTTNSSPKAPAALDDGNVDAARVRPVADLKSFLSLLFSHLNTSPLLPVSRPTKTRASSLSPRPRILQTLPLEGNESPEEAGATFAAGRRWHQQTTAAVDRNSHEFSRSLDHQGHWDAHRPRHHQPSQRSAQTLYHRPGIQPLTERD
ncbi:hypothetical protein NHJ13734_009591, partial [Beauveria thailandica]